MGLLEGYVKITDINFFLQLQNNKVAHNHWLV